MLTSTGDARQSLDDVVPIRDVSGAQRTGTQDHNHNGPFLMSATTAATIPSLTGRRLLAVVLTFLLTRVLFEAVGFRYAVFSDPLNLPKLFIDLGAWAAIYTLVSWLLLRHAPR